MSGQNCSANLATPLSIHAQKSEANEPFIQPAQFSNLDAPGVPRFKNLSRTRHLQIHVITGRERSVFHVRQHEGALRHGV
jgi:hypothetical protein